MRSATTATGTTSGSCWGPASCSEAAGRAPDADDAEAALQGRDPGQAGDVGLDGADAEALEHRDAVVAVRHVVLAVQLVQVDRRHAFGAVHGDHHAGPAFLVPVDTWQELRRVVVRPT